MQKVVAMNSISLQERAQLEELFIALQDSRSSMLQNIYDFVCKKDFIASLKALFIKVFAR